MDTFLNLHHRKTSGGDRIVDGVTFKSYDVGVLRYALISQDGQIFVARNYCKSTYRAAVVGIGDLKSRSGRPKAFRTEKAALRAGVAALKIRG